MDHHCGPHHINRLDDCSVAPIVQAGTTELCILPGEGQSELGPNKHLGGVIVLDFDSFVFC